MRPGCAVLLAGLLASAGSQAADPSALWRIVSGQCVPHGQALLWQSLDKIGTAWSVLPVDLAGHRYRTLRIQQESLRSADPFRLLAQSDERIAADMGIHTLVMVGATFADGTDGFVLLDDHADILAGNLGVREQLQDHACRVASR